MIQEVMSPCRNCEFIGRDKNTGICKKCIDSGRPLDYVKSLGGLSESLPLDTILIGNGGLEIIQIESEIDENMEYDLDLICKIHNVAYKNLKRGSVGAPFYRARIDIIKYFIANNELDDRGYGGIGQIIGLTSNRVGQIVRSINNGNEF